MSPGRRRRFPRRPINRALPDLPPLPEGEEPACPGCGETGTLQHTEKALRWWNLRSVTEDGVLVFDGDFDWADDGEEQDISCWSCGGAWSYASAPDVDFA